MQHPWPQNAPPAGSSGPPPPGSVPPGHHYQGHPQQQQGYYSAPASDGRNPEHPPPHGYSHGPPQGKKDVDVCYDVKFVVILYGLTFISSPSHFFAMKTY